LLFREANDMASHAFIRGRECLHVIGSEGERDANERDKRDGYNCSHCVSCASDRAVTAVGVFRY
jgi:hypothetical protein